MLLFTCAYLVPSMGSHRSQVISLGFTAALGSRESITITAEKMEANLPKLTPQFSPQFSKCQSL